MQPLASASCMNAPPPHPISSRWSDGTSASARSSAGQDLGTALGRDPIGVAVHADVADALGDVDVLVAAADAAPVMDAVVALPAVDTVLGRGPSKTIIVTRRGTQVDVRVVAPAQLGAALRWEHAPSRGEDFPHLYGALPLSAVQWREPLGRDAAGAFMIPERARA